MEPTIFMRNKKYRIVITGKKTRKEKELNTMPARKNVTQNYDFLREKEVL